MRPLQEKAEAPISTIDAPAKDAVDEAQGPRPGREGSRFVGRVLPVTRSRIVQDAWWSGWQAHMRHVGRRVDELMQADRETARAYLALVAAGYDDGLPPEAHALLREVVGP